jgi:hypothetical protein
MRASANSANGAVASLAARRVRFAAHGFHDQINEGRERLSGNGARFAKIVAIYPPPQRLGGFPESLRERDPVMPWPEAAQHIELASQIGNEGHVRTHSFKVMPSHRLGFCRVMG